jgi:hypothetical protein
LSALLTSREYQGAAPLVGPLTSMSATGVAMLVPDATPIAPARGDVDASTLAVSFHAAYGAEVELQIVEGNHPCWLGPVRMESLELLPDARVLLGLSFTGPSAALALGL